MGVEPTAARSARPATDFEDRGIHRDTTTPVDVYHYNQPHKSKQPLHLGLHEQDVRLLMKILDRFYGHSTCIPQLDRHYSIG